MLYTSRPQRDLNPEPADSATLKLARASTANVRPSARVGRGDLVLPRIACEDRPGRLASASRMRSERLESKGISGCQRRAGIKRSRQTVSELFADVQKRLLTCGFASGSVQGRSWRRDPIGIVAVAPGLPCVHMQRVPVAEIAPARTRSAEFVEVEERCPSGG